MPSNIRPTSRRPKKPSRAQRQDIRSHPLVDPGNPPHSSTSRAKTHSTRRCHRMVALAAGSSSRSTEISYQTKITAAMLASLEMLLLWFWRPRSTHDHQPEGKHEPAEQACGSKA